MNLANKNEIDNIMKDINKKVNLFWFSMIFIRNKSLQNWIRLEMG